MCKADTESLKTSKALGANDGEILEANQIIGYFNYLSRFLYGLGVATDDVVVGYYNSDCV